jgi:hypothetical protein
MVELDILACGLGALSPVNLSKLDGKHGLRRSLVALTVWSTFETTLLKAKYAHGHALPGEPAHNFALTVLVLPLFAQRTMKNVVSGVCSLIWGHCASP